MSIKVDRGLGWWQGLNVYQGRQRVGLVEGSQCLST